ncbi:hypothetical protein ACHQM5_030236 [Ranunculus cassubicifolius]
MRTARTLSTSTPPPSSSLHSVGRIPHSPWHSPVPYLFGGLAAMLGLIAFALLILACSYWKLSGNFENEEENERDLENGDEKNGDAGGLKAPPVYEEKIVVIMAGDAKPTYLATPMSSRASSFGSNTGKEVETTEKLEKAKQDIPEEDSQQQEQEHENRATAQTQSNNQESLHIPPQDQQL